MSAGLASRLIWKARCRFAHWRARRAGVKLHRTASITPATCFAGDAHLVTIGAGSRLSGCVLAPHSGSDWIWKIDTRRPIVLGERVFVGVNAIVCAGAVIGDGAIIGAGSVVRGYVRPGAIVVGNPGHVVGDVTDYVARHRARAVKARAFR